jgi:hypothetical protein
MYRISRAAGLVELVGAVAGTAWEGAQRAAIDHYPWYKGGKKQSTAARLLYDDDALYVQFRCQDQHSSAARRKLNGRVCVDSCVELFVTVEPERCDHYFNLEINCCGAMLLGFSNDDGSRRDVTEELAEQISIVTSTRGKTKCESPRDRQWWVAARVPFAMLREFTERPIQPAAGTEWRLNFYRCGGQTEPQYASWQPMDVNRPNFHMPEFFGAACFL